MFAMDTKVQMSLWVQYLTLSLSSHCQLLAFGTESCTLNVACLYGFAQSRFRLGEAVGY